MGGKNFNGKHKKISKNLEIEKEEKGDDGFKCNKCSKTFNVKLEDFNRHHEHCKAAQTEEKSESKDQKQKMEGKSESKNKKKKISQSKNKKKKTEKKGKNNNQKNNIMQR